MSHLERWKTAAEKKAHRKAQLKYESTPLEIKKREARNRARYNMEKEGKVHKGDKKDVQHSDGNALHNVPSNWSVGSQHNNRSYPRTSKAHKLYKSS